MNLKQKDKKTKIMDIKTYHKFKLLATAGLISINFVLSIIATVVFGFHNLLSNTIVTLNVMHKEITSSSNIVPSYYLGSYILMIIGLISSGIASIIISLNFIPSEKITKNHKLIYNSAVALNLLAMVLILIGQITYVTGTVSANYPLGLSDCFGMYHFFKPFILASCLPLALVILIIVSEKKLKPKEQSN